MCCTSTPECVSKWFPFSDTKFNAKTSLGCSRWVRLLASRSAHSVHNTVVTWHSIFERSSGRFFNDFQGFLTKAPAFNYFLVYGSKLSCSLLKEGKCFVWKGKRGEAPMETICTNSRFRKQTQIDPAKCDLCLKALYIMRQRHLGAFAVFLTFNSSQALCLASRKCCVTCLKHTGFQCQSNLTHLSQTNENRIQKSVIHLKLNERDTESQLVAKV